MLMGEAGSNIYHMKIHSTINSTDNNQFILMQCILKIILFLFVSEYLRRSLVSRKSNEVLMRIHVLQGRVSLWYRYREAWWRAAGFGALAFGLAEHLLCCSGGACTAWGSP